MYIHTTDNSMIFLFNDSGKPGLKMSSMNIKINTISFSFYSVPPIGENMTSSALSHLKWPNNVEKLQPAEIIVSISTTGTLRISIPPEAPPAPSAPLV